MCVCAWVGRWVVGLDLGVMCVCVGGWVVWVVVNVGVSERERLGRQRVGTEEGGRHVLEGREYLLFSCWISCWLPSLRAWPYAA